MERKSPSAELASVFMMRAEGYEPKELLEVYLKFGECPVADVGLTQTRR